MNSFHEDSVQQPAYFKAEISDSLYYENSDDERIVLSTRILLNDDLISMQKLVLCYIMENHMINKWLQTGFCLNNDLLSMQKSVLCYIMENHMINKWLQKGFYSNN